MIEYHNVFQEKDGIIGVAWGVRYIEGPKRDFRRTDIKWNHQRKVVLGFPKEGGEGEVTRMPRKGRESCCWDVGTGGLGAGEKS